MGYAFLPRTGTDLTSASVNKSNIFDLLLTYPFRYFNRHPYANYISSREILIEHSNSNIGFSYKIIEKGPWEFRPGDDKPPYGWTFDNTRLEEISVFSLDELRALALSHQLLGKLAANHSTNYISLDNNYKYPSARGNEKYKIDYWGLNLYEDILLVLSKQRFNFEFNPQPITLKILPSPETKSSHTAQFFDSLRRASRPVAFEIQADEVISFLLTFAPEDQAYIEEQLHLHFPNFGTQPYSPAIPQPLYRCSITTAQAYLGFRKLTELGIDPYVQLFNRFAQTSPDNIARLQIIINPLTNDTVKTIRDYFADKEAKEIVRALDQKSPAFLPAINLFATDPQLLEQMHQTLFKQLETTEQRFLITPNTKVDTIDYQLKPWSFLSIDELVTLAHFPIQFIDSDKLETASMKSKLPPELYTQSGAVIGQCTARGITKTVTLPDSIRNRHTYIIGRSRSGKSTLLTNLIVQDIQAGNGVCVLDPHGELTETILNYIPQERVKDTIYLDVTDEAHPIPLNILNAADTGNIALLVDDLVSTFKRLVDSAMWSSRMDALLRNSAQLLLRQPQPRAFLDIRKVLRNSEYRERLLENVTYEPVREFWEEDFPAYPKDAVQPILHRMSRFSDFPTLYAMLSTPKSKINFDEIMQQRKILLVNPAAGIIGEDNSKLIGCLIVSQLQLAAMRRAKIPQEERIPFSLYVDEFQNFIASPFDRILSEARKYQLCLTFAHQFISQLDDITRDAILGNVGTIVVMSINEKDAGSLRRSVGDYEITDILNLDAAKHEALCRPLTKASDTFSFVTSSPPQRLAQSNRQAIIEHTRSVFGVQMDSPQPEVVKPSQPVAATPQASRAPKFCSQCGSPAAGGNFCMNCGNPFAAPAQPVSTPPEPAMGTPELPLEKIRMPRPAPAIPKTFSSNRDKVLYYLEQAQYLTTPQIISLCYTQKSNASADLTKLVAEKKIKEIANSRPKIYYLGAAPNVTDHNLCVRELFVKIARSNFEIARVDFNLQLGNLNPDLCVDFVLPDGKIQKTFWEYDTGTEGTNHLKTKVERYKAHSPTENDGRGGENLVSPRPPLPVIFVFKDRSIFNRVMPAIETPFTYGVVLSEFETMDDATFNSSLFAPP